ncbi:salivary glue protein Sgs-3-like [Platysternon megacephalum]|uniref:Salivary glue protein Sgs-3-like n=1 Tax=Platysternon megacephalum TaxID=55544 RepID=A0A4D9DRB2_9SAUR|nr:salivary glue protein Sgs-3-like [Platysternon megacephalum]
MAAAERAEVGCWTYGSVSATAQCFLSTLSGNGAGTGLPPQHRELLRYPVAGAPNVTVASVTTLLFGTVSYFGTDADFGVNTVPGTTNNGGVLSAGRTISTIGTSPLISLGYWDSLVSELGSYSSYSPGS